MTAYLIERCQGAGCTIFTQAGTTTGSPYNDTGLTSGATYRYRVRATDAAGNFSGYSSVASATTPDTQPPTAPSGLAAAAVSGSQVNLNWTASTDNVGVTGYFVERCQGGGCTTFSHPGRHGRGDSLQRFRPHTRGQLQLPRKSDRCRRQPWLLLWHRNRNNTDNYSRTRGRLFI